MDEEGGEDREDDIGAPGCHDGVHEAVLSNDDKEFITKEEKEAERERGNDSTECAATGKYDAERSRKKDGYQARPGLGDVAVKLC